MRFSNDETECVTTKVNYYILAVHATHIKFSKSFSGDELKASEWQKSSSSSSVWKALAQFKRLSGV